MRGRLVDAALMVLLVVVAFGITWTLFTLNRGDPSRARTVATATADGAEEAGGAEGGDAGVVPVAPVGVPIDPIDADAGTDADAGADVDADADAGAGADADAGAPEADAEAAAPAEPERPRRPVPEGAVELERVGFSFVTGGPGACGIVLEPWTHVAVSRELLDAYGCGARVRLALDEEVAGRSDVELVVADTMPPSIERTANVYVGTDEPAFGYGVTTGSVLPLD